LKALLSLFVFFLVGNYCIARQADSINTARAKILFIGLPAAHLTSAILLNELWYKDQPKQGFHFFNDGAEWNQVDKFGHFYSAFYFNFVGSSTFRWAGFSKKNSDLLGGATSLLFMTTIEIMDGYSSGYGASGWDVISNLGGIGFYLLQQSLWNEIRIVPKFSYSPTQIPEKRPDVLGKNFTQQIFKDYNGQTYWLSFDVYSFLPKGNTFPKWINFTLGYGSYNLLYARHDANINAGLDPFRQYYLALDFDLSHIRTRNTFVKSLLYMVNLIHLPAPGIEFNSNNKVKLHLLTF